MSIDDRVAANARFKDRSAGLIIFGLFQILIGGCFALLTPFMLLTLFIAPRVGTPASARTMIPAIGFYAVLAVAFIWLGIGSFLARRWARALTLVLAWLWLVTGALSLIMMSVWMPDIFTSMSQQQQTPPQMQTIMLAIQVVTLGMMVFLYLVFPAIFVLFYRSPHVKATCEFKDPHVRWTDKCPLPVLALSVMLGLGAVSLVLSAGSGFGIPFFGTVLRSAAGILATLAIAGLFAYLAWATYRLKISAWWATIAAFAFGFASAIVTFSRIDLMEFYRESGMPEEQLKVIEETGMIEKMNMPVMMGVSGVVLLGLLLWVRRYMVAAPAARADS
jgi:hypothetical protein